MTHQVRDTRASRENLVARLKRRKKRYMMKLTKQSHVLGSQSDNEYYLMDGVVPVRIISTESGSRRVEFYNREHRAFEPRRGVLVAISFGRFPGVRETSKPMFEKALKKLQLSQ